MDTVYLNGKFVPRNEAFVSVDDRGFLFGDACYEATPAFAGKFLHLDRHVQRLQNGLDELRIDFTAAELGPVHRELLVANGLQDAPFALVYAQVTRGAAARSHAFPAEAVPPTVYACAKARDRVTGAEFNAGFTAITVDDLRWARPDIKTTNLLPNVLAQQAAVDAGVDEAALVREVDGRRLVTEGAHNNIFIVADGVVITAPADRSILPGVTRQHLIELAERGGLRVDIRPYTVEELFAADEVFFSGTGTEVRPVVIVDGAAIGSGMPGPVTRHVKELFDASIAEM